MAQRRYAYCGECRKTTYFVCSSSRKRPTREEQASTKSDERRECIINSTGDKTNKQNKKNSGNSQRKSALCRPCPATMARTIRGSLMPQTYVTIIPSSWVKSVWRFYPPLFFSLSWNSYRCTVYYILRIYWYIIYTCMFVLRFFS